MDAISTWSKVIRIGDQREQSPAFSDKLKNRNRLSLLCALFSLFYFCFFLHKGLYLPFFAITLGIILFVISILLNHYKKYLLSSVLLLINTNYCVLFFSFYLGFDSGIHLYLFTSPLIVLSLFSEDNKKLIYPAMSSYIINFLVIFILKEYSGKGIIDIEKPELDLLYVLNFVLAISILISLSLYFLFNNNKINNLLTVRNEELKEENSIRRKAEETLGTALKERELLLSEIHHRVKNNLAVVSGLLSMQAANLKDTKSKNIFEETKNRIYSMSLIHNQLYRNQSFSQIEFSQYITASCSYLQKSCRANTSFEIILRTEKIQLDIKTAIPCALILNELLTNSFKHAFKNVSVGIVEVGCKREADSILFWVYDSGVGMDAKHLKSTTMGMNVVNTLVDQIDGKLEYTETAGSKFLIRFNAPVN